MNHREMTGRYWDKQGREGWEEGRETYQFFNRFYEEHKSELGRDVLDVGCGNGRYMMPFARDKFRIVGLDPSGEMIGAAQRKFADQNLQAEFVQGESRELPFADGSFDFVISTGAIHHNTMEDIRESFREISRVLRPGKDFLFMGRSIKDKSQEREITEDFRGQGFGFTAVDKEGIKKGVVQHYFNEVELRQLGEENGFEVMVEPHEQIGGDGKSARLWVVYKKKG